MRRHRLAPHGYRSIKSRKFRLLAIIALVSIGSAHAAEIVTSSVRELQTAIDSAQAGDVLILANGTYLNNTIKIVGSSITVRAATPGGVYLNGTDAISILGSNVTFSGFQFTSGTIPGFVITVLGSNNTLTQLNFNGYSAQKYINLKAGSQRNTITYSNFQNKPASAPQGNLIEVEADPSVIGYHTIGHNSCQHMPGRGGDNGNECIRLGEGAQSTYISRTVVEYNYFEDTGLGDSEAISVKSRENVLRWNTMKNNPDAMFVFRNGDNNVCYGNFFLSSGGIRVKEANSIYCYNNYFERSGVGGSMNAVTYDFISPNLRDINFIHNTFVDSGLIALSAGATGNTWADNVFRSASGSIFSGSPSGISWAGNLYAGKPGIAPPSGLSANADLGLALNAYGYYGLSTTSVARGAGVPFPAILSIAGIDGDYAVALDVAGQTRGTVRDAGSVAFGATGAMTNRPLALSDVGPSYLQSSVRAFNSASYLEGTFAQDSIVTLFGNGLALRNESWDGSAVTTLAGASVNLTDSTGTTRAAQLFFAGPGQINLLVPPGSATGPATIVATKSGGASAQAGIATIASSAAGIFTLSPGSSVPAALFLRISSDGQQTTGYVFDVNTLSAVDIPRNAGDQTYLILFGTGLRHSNQIAATANGRQVPVLAALAQGQFPGLDQINLGPLPFDLPGGTVSFHLFDEGREANLITVRLQ